MDIRHVVVTSSESLQSVCRDNLLHFLLKGLRNIKMKFSDEDIAQHKKPGRERLKRITKARITVLRRKEAQVREEVLLLRPLIKALPFP